MGTGGVWKVRREAFSAGLPRRRGGAGGGAGLPGEK